MLTHTTLSHEQICALLADIAGTKPDAVVVTPLTGNEASAVKAVIATDIKGANRLDRALPKDGAATTSEKPDVMEARRSFERDVITDAYDYALASLGCARDGSSVMTLSVGDAAKHLDRAQAQLLRTARLLAAAVAVDARLAPLRGLDRILGPYGRAGTGADQ